MTKLFWYCYFSLYMLYMDTKKIKFAYLRKFHPEKADDYGFEKIKEISNHVLKMSKTDVKIYGHENLPEGPCVLIGNHQAIFDAFLMLATAKGRTGFIAKQQIKKVPFVGSWLARTGTVYINREDIKEGVKAIMTGVENVKNGYSMVLFPEGTRSLASKMGEFKKGSLKLALKAGVPVIPFTLDGTYRILEVGNQVRGHQVKIMYHEPIYVENLSRDEQKHLGDTLHGIIEGGLNKMLSE